MSHKAVETMVNGTLQPEMTEQSFRERICRGMQEIMKKKMSGIDGSLYSMGNAGKNAAK